MVRSRWVFLLLRTFVRSLLRGLPISRDQPHYKNELAKILIPLQERRLLVGFSFYDYQQYGTAMALLSLRRCLSN